MVELTMYLIVRRDLLSVLKWPLGAVITQACHASTAIVWEQKENPNVIEYMKKVDSMRKVVVETESEESLRLLSQKLTDCQMIHKVWIEQPENIATCLAVMPYPKDTIRPHLKKLKLFS